MIRAAALQGLRDIAGKLGYSRIVNVMGTQAFPRAFRGDSRRGWIACQNTTSWRTAAQAESAGLASCAADAERLLILPARGTPPAHGSKIISLGKLATRIFRFVRQISKAQLALFLCFSAICTSAGQGGASHSCASCASLHARIFHFREPQVTPEASRKRAGSEPEASRKQTSFSACKCFCSNAKGAYGKDERAASEPEASRKRAASDAGSEPQVRL